MLRRNLIAAAGLSGLRLSYASPLTSTQAKKVIDGPDIPVASSFALSGPAEIIGKDLEDGIRASIKAANRRGGIGGRMLRFTPLDDAYEPDRCQRNFEAQIQEHAAVWVTPAGTPTCLKALPLMKRFGIPVFGMYTGAATLREFLPNVYHLRASYLQEVELGMTHLLTESSQIALCLQNDAYGRAIGDASLAVLDAYKPAPVKPVAIGLFERNSLDVREAARAIQNSTAKGIMFGGTYTQLAELVKILGLGYAYQTVSFTQTTGVQQKLREKARGFRISQVVPSPWSMSTRLGVEYRAAMTDIGKSPTYGSLEGYIAMEVAIRAMRAAKDNLTWENIVAAAQQDHDLQGFRLSFSRSNREGSRFVDNTCINQYGEVVA